MKRNIFQIAQLCLPLALFMLLQSTSMAGNKDRVGQAGASQLLINPWARSSGWAGANTATVTGLESTNLNVAGLAFTKKSEFMFARTNLVPNSDISINNFGFSQRVGKKSVIGVAVTSMSFGEMQITTVDLPEGGLGTFSPQYLNLGLSYSREFSNSIYGGITFRVINEGISDAKASGMAFDAGIRYITGEKENIKFGIALKNVGPRMQYNGDGFSTKVTYNDQEITLEQRTAPYELPAQLVIGFSYDYLIGDKVDSTGKQIAAMHRVTGAGNFTSNSFGKDQIQAGVEYAFKNQFMLRAGYCYEDGITNSTDRTTWYTGPTFGATVEMPLGKGGSTLGIDYSYRTSVLGGTNSIGVRLNL